MRVSLDIKKTLEQNAELYFQTAKKARKKLAGAKKALEISKKKQADKPKQEIKTRTKVRRLEWFEKFRWFISSDGFLCVGGRDAATNEIIIKKHTLKDDLVLHTQMAGSPFVVIKAEGKPIPETTKEEAATFTAAVSRAWKNQMSTSAVDMVNPDQVTKQANAGEYLEKGAFMIRGKTKTFTSSLNFAIGIYNNKIMGGPASAVKKHCTDYLEIIQGDDKPSELAKSIRAKLGGELDDIIRVLPSGGCALKKQRNK